MRNELRKLWSTETLLIVAFFILISRSKDFRHQKIVFVCCHLRSGPDIFSTYLFMYRHVVYVEFYGRHFQFHRFLFQCCKTNLRYLNSSKLHISWAILANKAQSARWIFNWCKSKKLVKLHIYIAKRRLQLLEIGGDQGTDYIRCSSKLRFYNLGKRVFFCGRAAKLNKVSIIWLSTFLGGLFQGFMLFTW